MGVDLEVNPDAGAPIIPMTITPVAMTPVPMAPMAVTPAAPVNLHDVRGLGILDAANLTG